MIKYICYAINSHFWHKTETLFKKTVTMTELTQQQSLGHRAQLFPVLDSKT
jgi:hypothetical protein